MENMDILQYFNENASKEEWKLVQDVYSRELVELLKELGMEGKKTFNLAELSVICVRCVLERDLEHVETIDHELGGASLESTKDMYMDIMSDTLKEYKEEENNG
jgi:hypothetical protein|nr:MAG TPA: hypothetical protein [Caudoviricetes sp.]